MKKKTIHLVIGIILVVLTGFHSVEDHPFLEKLKERLAAFNTSYPEEKIYVQFDKPFYKPGDDIWLNTFVLNANSHKPSLISDVVYVDLIDPKGNVATSLELIVREGTAHGDFHLNESAPGGLYQVRAYTRWMKNSGKESFFTKEIQVQRIITPRLLLKLDYDKESYGPGDLVTAKLKISNLKNEKVADANVDVSVRLKGVETSNAVISSDAGGVVHISFLLSDTLSTADGLLQAVVSTRGTQESISRSIPIVLNKVSLRFFPEGGHYVENVKSRIAFKALNEFGKGADVSGVVIDKRGRIITSLESFHMGMGAFDFQAAKGENYFVRIQIPSGNKELIPLPTPLPSGFALSLRNRDDTSLEWLIHSPSAGDAYLVANSHGEIVYSKKIEVHAGENIVSVPTKEFPAGIVVFTLFDYTGLEQCERLVFVNGNKGLTIELKTDKQQYLPREPVRLQIKTLDGNGKPVAAKASLSVVDDQLISFADDKQDNLLSRMLLSSEVKGEIQEPSFYFDSNEEKASKALDYLLMTQGWRRFSWKDVLDTKRVITYAPERIKNVGGMVLNSQGLGFSSDVTLLELGGKKRIVKVQATREGHFLFKNIDPTIPLLLLTKKPGEIMLQKNPSFSISLNDREGTIILPAKDDDEVSAIAATQTEPESTLEQISERGLTLSMDNDVTQLSEVVITAFGVEDKKKLTGSITRVNENSLDGMFSAISIESALQGRVAGVIIQPQTGNPASQASVMIRGISSLSGGRAEPLYVIDGHPMGTSLSENFSNGSMVGPDDILSIEVMSSPEASAIYGSRAANGALLITTRSRLGYMYFKSTKKAPKFSSVRITPRQFSATREFYVAPPSVKKDEVRKDFRTTVFWSHTVVTNNKGEATVMFHNTDAISAFRITAEGFSGAGLIGRSEQVYHTELPLSLDTKLPEYLGFEDVLTLPIHVRNETASGKSAVVTLNLPKELSVEGTTLRNVNVGSKSSETLWFTIKSTGVSGEFPVSVKLESGNHTDEMHHTIKVKAVGFPMQISFAAKELDKSIPLSIADAEKNSIKAEVTAFPDVLSDLFTGAESILQQPHGCFEQVSSSTFPNILALQFLRHSGLSKPEVESKALGYIRDGYSRLTAYEIKGGGFEWFGHPPAHEGLTAYGLLQFAEMKKVFSGVDEKMVDRTRDWLLSKRNGKGGFRQSSGKYGFSAASQDVTNAYITYALSETGTKEILPEYGNALEEVLESQDMYRMALVAGTAFNLGKNDVYAQLSQVFKDKVKKTGFQKLKAEHSIVRSYGNSLQIETLSQWAVALMKSPDPDLLLLADLLKQILSFRTNGYFGSTQGTTLALKALTEYARLIRTAREDGELAVYVNDALADRLAYKRDARGKLVLNNFSQALSTGEQSLRVRFNGTENPLPYSVDVQWYTKKPQSSELCKVSLSTVLNSRSVRVNEVVRLTAILTNKSAEGLPMTVAVIGIPAGLSAQPWQLKELKEKGVFDFYEVTNGNLVIYYREMPPGGQHIIDLDLKAEIPGTYLGAASSAYLYYTNEFKHWVDGNTIVIR